MNFNKQDIQNIVNKADTLLIKYNQEYFKVRTELAIEIVTIKTRINQIELTGEFKISIIESILLDFATIETDINLLVPKKLKNAIDNDLQKLRNTLSGQKE